MDANGVISSYLLTLTDENNDSSQERTSLMEFTFNDLMPFTSYIVRIQAFTDSDAIMGDSSQLNFTTDIGSECPLKIYTAACNNLHRGVCTQQCTKQ